MREWRVREWRVWEWWVRAMDCAAGGCGGGGGVVRVRCGYGVHGGGIAQVSGSGWTWCTARELACGCGCRYRCIAQVSMQGWILGWRVCRWAHHMVRVYRVALGCVQVSMHPQEEIYILRVDIHCPGWWVREGDFIVQIELVDHAGVDWAGASSCGCAGVYASFVTSKSTLVVPLQ